MCVSLLFIHSAHADAKGIMQLIRQVGKTNLVFTPFLFPCLPCFLHPLLPFPPQSEPRNVMLVHGEAAKMDFLKQKIMQEFGVSCYMPANGETVAIATTPSIPVDVSRQLFKRTLEQCYGEQDVEPVP